MTFCSSQETQIDLTRRRVQSGFPLTARRRPSARIGAVGLLLALTAACDQSFEPIQESERSFSIFGYLDASAETQWIRVMRTRPLIVTGADPSSAIVTLKNVATGRTIVLRDSVFEYSHNQEVGAEGVFIRNYWTSERIEPGGVYDFAATGADGTTATGLVPIPREYSISVALGQRTGQADELRIGGVENLAFVETRTDIRYDCELERFVHRPQIREDSSDPHVLYPFKVVPVRSDCGAATIERRELWIAGTVDPWPRGVQFSTGGLNITELSTNLSGAVGFLGGVLTRLIPYEDCTLVGPTPPTQHCVLNYDGELITLRGTVREVDCQNSAVPRAAVTLEALTPDATGFRKIRPNTTTRAGAYRISALDAGVRYALSVTHPARLPGNVPQYLAYADTLEFGPGEQATYDVVLRRQEPC